MQAARGVLALAGAAFLGLAACGSGDGGMMRLRPTGNGPDEFGILPPKSLDMPQSLTELPAPTPGGGNRTDPTPEADAIVALGGRAPAAGSIPAADQALYTHAARNGRTEGIRQQLAAEDQEFRSRNRGRFLPRLFGQNTYFSAYDRQTLDKYDELARWRRAGAATPSAPPKADN